MSRRTGRLILFRVQNGHWLAAGEGERDCACMKYLPTLCLCIFRYLCRLIDLRIMYMYVYERHSIKETSFKAESVAVPSCYILY